MLRTYLYIPLILRVTLFRVNIWLNITYVIVVRALVDYLTMAMRSMFTRFVFGDTEFCVPERYTDLNPMGGGAQGVVW